MQKISVYDRYFTNKMSQKQIDEILKNEHIKSFQDKSNEEYREPPVIDQKYYKKRYKKGHCSLNFEPIKLFPRDDTLKYLLSNEKFKVYPAYILKEQSAKRKKEKEEKERAKSKNIADEIQEYLDEHKDIVEFDDDFLDRKPRITAKFELKNTKENKLQLLEKKQMNKTGCISLNIRKLAIRTENLEDALPSVDSSRKHKEGNSKEKKEKIELVERDLESFINDKKLSMSMNFSNKSNVTNQTNQTYNNFRSFNEKTKKEIDNSLEKITQNNTKFQKTANFEKVFHNFITNDENNTTNKFNKKSTLLIGFSWV